MKFECERDTDRGEPVAMIAEDGDLVFVCETGGIVFLPCGSGVDADYGIMPFYKLKDSAQKLFYRGDKITITL